MAAPGVEGPMALKTHPDHLRNQRIIPIEGPAPTFTFEGQSYDTQQLAKALEIQLSERMRLVKKDAVVADLLFLLDQQGTRTNLGNRPGTL